MVASHIEQGAPRRAVILTALQVEFQAVREHLSDCHEDVHPQGTVYEKGRFHGEHGDWEVLVVEVGEGNARTAMEVERAIGFFAPEVTLFVGVAGGLKDVFIGDVVFAPKVYGYESGKETADFEPRPDAGESSYVLEQRARAVARKTDWLRRIRPSPPKETVRARPGPIASGEKVLADTGSPEYQRLRKQYGDALAVEKEGRGFLVSVRANRGVDALVIRGISDLISGKAEADASGSQELASRHASAFAFELLSTFHLPNARPSGEHPREARQNSGGPVWTVPYLRNASFTGRDSLFQQIRTCLLAASSQPALVALHGLGGVGKTQLAVEYTFRHTQKTEGYTHVLWIRADGPTVLATSYAAMADALDLPEKASIEKKEKHDAVRRWLQQNPGWLLIFDNAENASDLQPYLPTWGNGHILITSRNPTWGELGMSLPVDVMERAESIAFLHRRTGQADESAAHALAEALGDLPLALAQAAAYIEQTQKSLTDYHVLFERRRQELLSRPGAPTGASHTVAATWELSFEQVRTQSPAGASLLALCAFLAPAPLPLTLLVEGAETLPEELAAAMADELLQDEAIGALRRYSLVQVVHGRLLFHRLVQMVMRDRLGEERNTWVVATLRFAHKVFDFRTSEFAYWTRCAEQLPHVLAAYENARTLGVSDDTTAPLLSRLGSFLESQAEYAQARNVLEWGIELVRQRFEPGSGPEVRFMAQLGEAHLALGEYAKSHEYLDKAMALIQAAPTREDSSTLASGVHSALGKLFISTGDLRRAREHAERAVALSDGDYTWILGNILLRQGLFAEARDCFEKDLKTAEANMPPEHPGVAAAHTNLAMALGYLGQYRQAEEVLERQLAILEGAYGPKHPRIASLLKTLGDTCQRLGNLTKARGCCERALLIDEARLGPNHLEVAIDLNNLARVLHELGARREARRDYERAIAIEEQLFGPNYSGLAPILSNLARVEEELGEHALARSHFERALALTEREHGSEHPDVATVCNNIGMLLARTGHLTEARPYIERALAIDERAYGPEHPEVATDLGNLAEILLQQGEDALGVRLFERALAIRQAQDPQPDDHLVFILSTLGKTAFDMSDLPAARTRLEQALQIQERTKPDSDLATHLRLQLALVLYRLAEQEEQPDEARQLLERMLQLGEAGKDESTQMSALRDLGLLLESQGDLHEAHRALSQALRLCEQVLGAESLGVADIAMHLGRVLLTQGPADLARLYLERSLAICQKPGSTNHTAQQTILPLLGRACSQTGDLKQSAECARQLLEFTKAKTAATPRELSNAHLVLGTLLLQAGQAMEAQPQLEEALRIGDQVFNEEPARTVAMRIHLGQFHLNTGALAGARKYFTQALQRAESLLGMRSANVAEASMHLGHFLSMVDELSEASSCFERTVDILETVDSVEPAAVAAVLHELAEVLLRQNLRDQAFEKLSRAESICQGVPQASVVLLQVLMTRGEASIEGSQWQDARRYFERIVQHQDFPLLPLEKQESVYSNLGVSLIGLEQPRLALESLDQALASKRRGLGTDHPGCISTLFNLGTALEQSGEPLKAFEHYKHALAILVDWAPTHTLIEKLRERLAHLAPTSR